MADTQTAASNPYSKGLIVALGNAQVDNPAPGTVVTRLAGGYYDIAPFLGAFLDLGNMVTQFSRNPYDPRPLVRMQSMAQGLLPVLRNTRNQPAIIREAISPMVQSMTSYLKNSQQLLQQRLRTSYQIARAPKILIPICLNIAAGVTITAIQIRNPYLGASGGQPGTYNFAWAITSFRTSNNESGQLSPIRITQWLFGGHDYVAASLGGVTFAGGGAPAVQGWPAAAFGETKRGNWKTEVQPWNVIAQHGGGTGFGSIMTETGLLQLAVNNGGTGAFVDTWSVYANATLCGNPLTEAKWTQLDMLRKSFAPLKLQAPIAMKLAGEADSWILAGVEDDDPKIGQGHPYRFASQVTPLLAEIEGFLDAPPEGAAMGPWAGSPEQHGFQLQGGATYAQSLL